MKINTKKATTVAPHCKVTDNKFIPEGFSKDQEDGGREVAFIPHAIFSPVLTSKRTESTRLSEVKVEELCTEISSMLISAKEESKEEEKVKKESKPKPKGLSKPLGRYNAEVIARFDNVVSVKRSLRLVD